MPGTETILNSNGTASGASQRNSARHSNNFIYNEVKTHEDSCGLRCARGKRSGFLRYRIASVCYYFLRVVTLGVVPFFAATTFLTIGITIGANLIAVLTIFDTFTNTTAPSY